MYYQIPESFYFIGLYTIFYKALSNAILIFTFSDIHITEKVSKNSFEIPSTDLGIKMVFRMISVCCMCNDL